MKRCAMLAVTAVLSCIGCMAGEKTRLTDWSLICSSETDAVAEMISTSRYDDTGWSGVKVPTTVLNALVKEGIYPDPRIGLNNYLIPDVSDDFNRRQNLGRFSYLKDGRNPWQEPYWYRTVFSLSRKESGKRVWLNFNGINYRADIWVNGRKIADKKDVVGMFRRFRFDISDYVHVGDNCIAVLIYQVDHPGNPSPGTQLVVFGPNRGTSSDIFKDETLKFSGGWDCAPVTRDRNMGIWQDVCIETTGDVTIEDPFVSTVLPHADTTTADLTISTVLRNNSAKTVSGRLDISVTLPEKLWFPTYIKTQKVRMAPIRITVPVKLGPGECREIKLSPKDYAALSVKNPHLWYPNGYGEQYMHELRLSFGTGTGNVSDSQTVPFGMREVKTALLKNGDDSGRVFYINGKRIFCRGGWLQPDALLDDSVKRIYDQTRLIANANINITGSEDMPAPPESWLDSWDKYGIMDWQVFYQCYRMFPGRDTEHNPLDKGLALSCMEDIVKRYRNHPCIVAWFGANEVVVDEELYVPTKEAVARLDPTRPYFPTTSVSWDVDRLTPYMKDDLPVGTTDDGAPDYNWAPSEYYFDKIGEVHLQMFKNELGMPSVPVYESLRKFIPGVDKPRDRKNPVYPLDSIWAEHGVWDANNFCYRAYDNAIRTFYSDPESAEDYSRKGQMVSAEGYRAMFEAANHRMWDITTGVMIWKLNSCWPDVCWQIYDWYLAPAAAYYFSKKAMEPLHIQMNANTGIVSVINTTGRSMENMKVKARVVSQDMTERWSKTETISVEADSYRELWKVPAAADAPSVYFIRLSLEDEDGNMVSENLYWRYSQHQNFRWLVTLPKVELKREASFVRNGEEYEIRLTLENNTDRLSFFNHVAVVGNRSKEMVNPVFWNDKFITLFPGESRTLTGVVAAEDLHGEEPKIRIN